MNVVFIGAGNMAEAVVSGVLKKQILSKKNICMTDISEERLQYFKEKYGTEISRNNALAIASADVVVLAVKPQSFSKIWEELIDELKPNVLVISIMAGILSDRISLGRPIRVVRVMPNTPALIGEGAAGIAAGEHALKEDVDWVEQLMRSVGTTAIVQEQEIDAVSALSGSGPAYVFYLLEGMLAAAEQMGLEKERSRELALATVIGAAKLMLKTGKDADVLRANVTSKGGSTAAAINTLEDRKVREAMVEALLAAQARGRELANV